MPRFLVVIERTGTGFSAFSPDLPGCIATGRTRAEVQQNMREAMRFHLEGLAEDHVPVPKPETVAEYVDVGDDDASTHV